MRFKLYAVLLLIIIQIFSATVLGQDYLWPTDASHYLTSSFAEYRPGHFHAGIDIKTWGQIGYKIFAIADGYISRLQVSPFGYGKVLYLTLKNGETVVYAHLSRFTDEIDTYVRQEQKRAGAYRIARYLNATKFPVKKGELLGYTGSTGIGYPHLHFELRDKSGRPVNPFLRGYQVEDHVRPTVAAISITPLDVTARVNADVKPLLLAPSYLGSGEYAISETPVLSGKIGFAVSCEDKADGVENSFAVYKLAFFINEKFIYSAQYDKFSYQESHFIDLDRDYRLRKRGAGLFQNLYKIKFNQLSFYLPAGEEVGILNCVPESLTTDPAKNLFGRGEFFYRIELSDFWGNKTTVSGKFVVARKNQISARIYQADSRKLLINEIKDQAGIEISEPEIFVTANSSGRWQQIKPVLINAEENFGLPSFYVVPLGNSIKAVKIQSREQFCESWPVFYASQNFQRHPDTTRQFILEKDFYDDFVRLELASPGRQIKAAQLTVQQLGLPKQTVPLIQSRLGVFFGVYQFVPEADGIVQIEVHAWDLADNELAYREQFDLQTVTPLNGGGIKSQDGKCRVLFEPDKVYQNLFLRLDRHQGLADDNFDAVGFIYEIMPQDVLLKGSATVELEYPIGDNLPDKLGIYSGSGNRWRLVGNQLDAKRNTIIARTANFGSITLLRDTVPPVIEIKKPISNSRLNQRRPVLQAIVFDELSGIANEKSIIMELDGQMVIAEFDPETESVAYQCEAPLVLGQHVLSVKATDNSKNKSVQTRTFYIVGP